MATTFPLSMQQLTARALRDDAILDVPLRLGELPWVFRFAIADVFAQIHAGEEAALESIRRVVEEDTLPAARDFARLQLRDEQRHVAFFASAREQLGIRRAPMTQLVDLFGTAVRASSLPSLLLANHLVVETLGHELFRDITTPLTRLAAWRWLPRVWRHALSSLADTLRIIFRDESRHVAFGVLRLKELRQRLPEVERERLDTEAKAWEKRLSDSLPALPVSPILRPWFRARVRAILAQYRQRCIDVGVFA